MGALPNVYPGYQNVTVEAARAKIRSRLGCAAFRSVGMTVTEMIPGIEDGRIRALYILGEDPVMSDPDSTPYPPLPGACATSSFLQEIFPSETAPYADVLLPGVSFAEKNWHVYQYRAAHPDGPQGHRTARGSAPDWQIIADLAKRILDFGERKAEFKRHSPDGIIRTHLRLWTKSPPLTPSYAGVSFERLERGDQLHWPVKDNQHPGTPILHVGQFTRGKGNSCPSSMSPCRNAR